MSLYILTAKKQTKKMSAELEYSDKFDTLPSGQNWLWWHFKRGACFIAANFANMIIIFVIIWLILTVITEVFIKKDQTPAQKFADSGTETSTIPNGTLEVVKFLGSSSLIILLSVVIIGGIGVTTSSFGAEVYGRLWKPCEQAL